MLGYRNSPAAASLTVLLFGAVLQCRYEFFNGRAQVARPAK
jgi:hypothetical protein